MSITPLPAPPQKTQTEVEFVQKADAFLGALPIFSVEANALATTINQNKIDAQTAADNAGQSEQAAKDAENIVLTSANFKGLWSSLTGSLNVPASVAHDGSYWQLLSNTTNVTQDVPGVSAKWAAIGQVWNLTALNNTIGTWFDAKRGALIAIPLTKIDSASPCITKTAAQALSIKAGTSVYAGGKWYTFASATAVTMPTLTAGNDYVVYVSSAGVPTALVDPFESPASIPAGATVIGGFHYSHVPTDATMANGSFATTGDGMIWTQTDVNRLRGINEFSIWDLRFRASAIANIPGSARNGQMFNHGLTYDPWKQIWVGIYFVSTDVDQYGLSKSGSNVASGTVAAKIPRAAGGNGTTVYTARGGLEGPGNWWDLGELMSVLGGRHPWEHEFNSFAFGTTEGISLGGSEVTIPLNKREAGYTSRIGVEQSSGHMYVWGMDSNFRQTGSTDSYVMTNVTGVRGQIYAQGSYGIVRPRFGGYRKSPADASGSRSSRWNSYPWGSYWFYSCRAVVTNLVL